MEDEIFWLLLKERALESTAEGVVISDCTQEGMPIIYVNKAFTAVTGYEYDEVIGRNCRFLQGTDTDPAARLSIRKALSDESSCIVEILNYRKDGTPFWNRLSITPVQNDQGRTTHYIGVQSDVTRRRLAEESLHKANMQLKRDLQAAAQIQQAQLPKELPDMEGYRFAWRFRPCEELAGDTLNIFWLDDTRVVVYVLDVCGHGVRASLQSFALNQDLRPVQNGPSLLSPEEVFARLNAKYPMDMQTGMYFTILYGILDTQTGDFTFSSAGHPGPILIRQGQDPRIIETKSLPIGISPDTEYASQTMKLMSQDKLILYTDGVVEAFNAANEPFSEDRLMKILLCSRNADVEGMLETVLKSLDNWACRVNPGDDVSLVGIEAL
ncbi:MAG TPA: SpoIIE family protein phosphatase [Anaerohalosphaeraceae bacterium]|nr:SpoIIE family protein phosphatase [Anaerohalosphaeraceae bacterium]